MKLCLQAHSETMACPEPEESSSIRITLNIQPVPMVRSSVVSQNRRRQRGFACFLIKIVDVNEDSRCQTHESRALRIFLMISSAKARALRTLCNRDHRRLGIHPGRHLPARRYRLYTIKLCQYWCGSERTDRAGPTYPRSGPNREASQPSLKPLERPSGPPGRNVRTILLRD
jgi:hypothetical protein